jgi:8-amino-7-oxononanoate synthase
MSLDDVAREVLGGIRGRGTYRRMRVLDGAQATRMRVDGRDCLLLAGSNYLDLAHHPEVTDAARAAAATYGCAAGGSRLITGNLELHEQLERELADFTGCEAALVFGTGYMANVGVIPALVGRDDVLVSDTLNHASIIDGARLSKARVEVIGHGDIAALEGVVSKAREEGRRCLLAIDGVYSMDGHMPPLRAMLEVARRHDCMTLLDDAHGTGTLGAHGRGSAEHQGVLDLVDVHMGTLGKALGAFGAFVAGSSLLRDLLVNTARSFIFSCALAPPQIAAARAAVSLVQREPGRRVALQMRATQLRDRLAAHGIATAPSTTQIVPVVIGDNETTMGVCEELLERGFYAQGIRFPSVPEGTARLRITPMATHTEGEIDAFVDALVGVLERRAPHVLGSAGPSRRRAAGA